MFPKNVHLYPIKQKNRPFL